MTSDQPATAGRHCSRAIPARAGIGLRAPHYRDMLDLRPAVGWVEVHSENYFGGGQPLHILEQIRRDHPVSLHGVGMSLGSCDELDSRHLHSLRELAQRIEPGLVSEHLCWSSVGSRHLNDLLPLPYTEEALDVVCRHLEQAQEFLGRQLLIENVSSYLQFRHSTLAEWDFLVEVARRSGCGILLDINNIHVSARNHGFDAGSYLQAIPRQMVGELHLAGYTEVDGLLIDTHGAAVSKEVWELYAEALARLGPTPTLIEWDTDIPALDVLLAEADKATAYLEDCRALAA